MKQNTTNKKTLGTSPEKDINGLERRRTKRKRFGKLENKFAMRNLMYKLQNPRQSRQQSQFACHQESFCAIFVHFGLVKSFFPLIHINSQNCVLLVFCSPCFLAQNLLIHIFFWWRQKDSFTWNFGVVSWIRRTFNFSLTPQSQTFIFIFV